MLNKQTGWMCISFRPSLFSLSRFWLIRILHSFHLDSAVQIMFVM